MLRALRQFFKQPRFKTPAAAVGGGLLLVGVALLAWKQAELRKQEALETELRASTGAPARKVQEATSKLKRDLQGWASQRRTQVASHQTVEMDADLSDLAIWKKGDSATPTRVAWWINSKFEGASTQWREELESAEKWESTRLLEVFHGRTVVELQHPVRFPSAMVGLWVAVPLGEGEVTEAVVAHVRSDRLARYFSEVQGTQVVLVDRTGMAIAPWSRSLSSNWADLFSRYRESEADGAAVEVRSEDGGRHHGAFQRVGAGELAVLSLKPSEAPAVSWKPWLLLLALMGCALMAYRSWFEKAPEAPIQGFVEEANPAYDDIAPHRQAVAVIHGSLRGFNQAIENRGPQDATDALNDYLTLVAARVAELGGMFESYAGPSFVAGWEILPEGANQAIECVLALREDLRALNESRKVDGKFELEQGLGVHVGQVLVARVGAAPRMTLRWIGEAVASARALDRLALSAKRDLLISREALQTSRRDFGAKKAGEARLTEETGLTEYCWIDDGTQPTEISAERLTSGETRVEILMPQEDRRRWLINNGTQMVGPFAPKEIAQLLFSQELDFDCECWEQESGKSAQIRTAGIFGACEEEQGARYWIYDGSSVHGPLSDGFLKTAVDHQAISAECYVCDTSTLQGWRPISEYKKASDPAHSAA